MDNDKAFLDDEELDDEELFFPFEEQEEYEITIDSCAYPDSLKILGDQAPKTLYALGNIDLLKQPNTMVFGRSKEYSDCSLEWRKISLRFLKQYIQIQSKGVISCGIFYNRFDELLLCNPPLDAPLVVVLPGGIDIETYEDLDESKEFEHSDKIRRVVEDGGLIISPFRSVKDYNREDYLSFLAALATNDIYVIDCSDKKESAIYFMDKAKEIGKNVIINQAAYSQLHID